MEIILLGIYSFFVWLIFIKLKWLPWTTPWKVAVAIFPIVMIAALLLLLNIVAPTTTDVRVIKYVVPIVSQVRGRVTEVGVENNRPVKKGDVLFRIDPTPYQNEVLSLEAKLAADDAKIGADRQRLSEMQARLANAQAGERQLTEQMNQAAGQVESVSASLDLARIRVPAEHGAGGGRGGQSLRPRDRAGQRQGADRAAGRRAGRRTAGPRADRRTASRATWRRSPRSRRRSRQPRHKSEPPRPSSRRRARNSKTRAGISTQTTVVAPGNGTMVNVMLRPGFFVAGMPFNEVMTFVDEEYRIFALFGQNELHQVKSGNEAEITLDTYPGHVIEAHVDSILWAQSQGQLDASGDLPRTTFVAPPGRFPVKLVVGESDSPLFLAAGARGSSAIYTDHLAPVHIIRKVILRVTSYLDYIIIKHSFSGH